MKLLRKVVKSSLIFSDGEYVDIDNTIMMPPPPAIEESDEEDPKAKADRIAEEERLMAIEKETLERESEIELRVQFLKSEIDRKEKEILELANEEKATLLAKARNEADVMVRTAEAEAIVLKAKAQAAAKELGFSEGKAEGLAKCESFIKAAAKLIGDINAKKEAYFITHQDELMDVAFELVEKIILVEIQTNKDVIYAILKQASKSFRNAERIKLTLSGCDISEEIITDQEFMRSVVGNIPEIEIELLEDAEPGTIKIDNGTEIIDASVPTQLDLLKEIFHNK